MKKGKKKNSNAIWNETERNKQMKKKNFKIRETLYRKR